MSENSPAAWYNNEESHSGQLYHLWKVALSFCPEYDTSLKDYIIRIYYGGDVYPMVIRNKDYAELRKNKTGKTFVYVREYPAWFLNPNFNKYDFSLQEEDWHERDRGKRPWSFLFMFILFEGFICMFVLDT